jgi:aminoglycoside phosphotransferase (APT) family kinase protein
MSEGGWTEREQTARAWLHEHAARLPFDVGDARLEVAPSGGGFANTSFRVRAGEGRWHLKLGSADASAGLRCWAAVHERLTSHYRAPTMILSAAAPEAGAWGALFEHVTGRGARVLTSEALDEVVAMLTALHGDRALAGALIEVAAAGSPETLCLEHYLENHDERFRADLESIPPDLPFLAPGDHDWMWSEVEALESHVRSAPAFQVSTRASVHGDLWSDNLLVAGDGTWHVVDWDDLRIGDPVVDYATVLGPAPHDLRGIDASRLARPLPLDAPARERMRTYARATLLDWVIDPLADWVDAGAAGAEASRLQTEKQRVHSEAKALYRARWG